MAVSAGAQAQEVWSLERCVDFAVRNNHEVLMAGVSVADCKADRLEAVGAFLPQVEAGVYPQFSFGRAVDPETNTFGNVNNFSSNFGLSASIPLFTGFSNLNDLRAKRASLLMGRQKLLAEKDAVAQDVIRCYIDALYYKGALEIASIKMAESQMLLHQSRVLNEIGLKGEADVAEMEAVCAGDDFEVARQRGLLRASLLQLKRKMNLTAQTEILLENIPEINLMTTDSISADSVFEGFCGRSPKILQAEYGVEEAEYSLKSSKGALMPSVSLGAEVSSGYYQTQGANHLSFSNQMSDNLGEWIYASVRIPIFGRMSKVADIRRSKNNLERARETLDFEKSELQRIIYEAVDDFETGLQEVEKMRAKVSADSIASAIIVRKFEEGLASAIDVRTATITAVQSKAQLLSAELNLYYKSRMINYYKGEPLWTE